MARTIQDDDLLLWEAYASSGNFGYPDGARMMFHCVSDPARRARVTDREGDLSDVAHEVTSLPDSTLLAMLAESHEVS